MLYKPLANDKPCRGLSLSRRPHAALRRKSTLHGQMSVKAIPEGFAALTPYLFAQGASRLIEFISAAFEGELIFQQKRPDGAIMHATMRIGDSMLMLADT